MSRRHVQFHFPSNYWGIVLSGETWRRTLLCYQSEGMKILNTTFSLGRIESTTAALTDACLHLCITTKDRKFIVINNFHFSTLRRRMGEYNTARCYTPPFNTQCPEFWWKWHILLLEIETKIPIDPYNKHKNNGKPVTIRLDIGSSSKLRVVTTIMC